MLDANILSYHIGFYVNISLMYLHDILDAFLLPINSKIHKSCKLKKKKIQDWFVENGIGEPRLQHSHL